MRKDDSGVVKRKMVCTMKKHKGIEMTVEENDPLHHARIVCSVCSLWIAWIFTKEEARCFADRKTDT